MSLSSALQIVTILDTTCNNFRHVGEGMGELRLYSSVEPHVHVVVTSVRQPPGIYWLSLVESLIGY